MSDACWLDKNIDTHAIFEQVIAFPRRQ